VVWLLVLGMVGLLVGAAVWSHQQAKKRRLALQAWAREVGATFDPGDDGTLEARYPEFSCLRQGYRRYGYNRLTGERNARAFDGFDYHYETYSTDSKGRRTTHHHYFSVLVVEAGLPLKPLLLRPEGFFDKITEFFGADDIDFESGEFSRAFFVKAPERRWAFDLLHQATMEFLLQSPRFTVETEGARIMVRRSKTFAPADFPAALGVAEGILDRLPNYLVQELKGGTP
jgi:hypothetical protein